MRTQQAVQSHENQGFSLMLVKVSVIMRMKPHIVNSVEQHKILAESEE